MNQDPTSSQCASQCLPSLSLEELNRDCFCIAVEKQSFRRELAGLLSPDVHLEIFSDTRANLFSSLPVYVSRRHLEQVHEVVSAIESVVSLPAYQLAAMSWAPDVAKFDPGSPGGLLGLDFHLDSTGPRLIEINTNPGGVLLNALLANAARVCLPQLTIPQTAGNVDDSVVSTMQTEWRLQRGSADLKAVAIVDDSPTTQYLYPEFLLFKELFQRHGYQAEIAGPEELEYRDDRLFLRDIPIDFVYNRLTDFSLQEPANSALKAAYVAGHVVVSPHPRGHALYADKRNLTILGSREFLESIGVDPGAIEALVSAVPATQRVTKENREMLWANRRRLFFKPAAGFGSKASYRGDKLTLRVWGEMAAGEYVAQQIVVPSERHVAATKDPLKLDIRCYAYRGKVLLYAARMYQGQTTNFRTPGGGFAPVLTDRTDGPGG